MWEPASGYRLERAPKRGRGLESTPTFRKPASILSTAHAFHRYPSQDCLFRTCCRPPSRNVQSTGVSQFCATLPYCNAAIFHHSTKISWNFFAPRLNYSCQPELDAGHLEEMSDPQTLGDEELLRLTRAGDESAFTLLYRRHQSPVFRFALQMSGDPNIADDVTQEVFLALMRESFQFDPKRGSLASYLYGVARNQVRRHLDRGRLQVPLDEDSDDDAFPLESMVAIGDPLGDLTVRENLSALRQAILTLPLHYREVVALCDLEELSYEEAARSIGCAVGTIRSRLHRAHALLVQKLREGKETIPIESRRSTMRYFS